MRENAESIAFYSGDQREAELAGGRLARAVATMFGKASGSVGAVELERLKRCSHRCLDCPPMSSAWRLS